VSVPELTPIEERIVLFVAAGASVEDVAAELGVGVRTVDWHLARARRKLERTSSLHDRVEQATQRAAMQEGGRQ
jgi:DNA-binding CsgD family transcriptional regulator